MSLGDFLSNTANTMGTAAANVVSKGVDVVGGALSRTVGALLFPSSDQTMDTWVGGAVQGTTTAVGEVGASVVSNGASAAGSIAGDAGRALTSTVQDAYETLTVSRGDTAQLPSPPRQQVVAAPATRGSTRGNGG